MQEYDVDNDGVVDQTHTSLTGAENRFVEITIETAEDGVVSETTRRWGPNGCLVEQVDVFATEASILVETQTRTCDEHGDPLEFEFRIDEEDPDSPFFGVNVHQIATFDPTYPGGDPGNGPREYNHLREWVATSREVDPALDTPTLDGEGELEYDGQDRLIRQVVAYTTGLTTTTDIVWHDDHPDFIESLIETDTLEDGESYVRSRNEFDYDEYGRLTRELEEIQSWVDEWTYEWEPERFAISSQSFTRDGEELLRGITDCGEENPWVTCLQEVEQADADGGFDGSVDWTLLSTYTCP